MLSPARMNGGPRPARLRRGTCLGLILALSLALNLFGIWWGQYHPDDFTSLALYMLAHGTLKPAHFWYPTLFTYVVLFFSVIPSKAVEVLALFLAGHHFRGAMDMVRSLDIIRPSPQEYLGPRILTAAIGTCGVYIIYRLGRFFSASRTGLLAALLLSVCMGYVTNAHFATADVPVTVMMLLSLLLCLRAGRKQTGGSYALAAAVIGLATSVKYYGIVMLCPFLIVYSDACLRKRIRWRGLPLFLLLVAAGFVAGTPHAVFSFFRFARDVLQLNLLTPHLKLAGSRPPLGYISHLKNLVSVLGAPLFAATAASLPYSLYCMVRYRNRELACVWAFILLFYLVIGRFLVAPSRYILPIIPLLLLLTAYTFDALLGAERKSVRFLSRAAMGAVVIYSFAYSLAGDFHLILDSKRMFLAWVRENIPEGSRIELTTYCPRPPGNYSAYYRPHAGGGDRYYSLLEESALYRFALRQGIIVRHLAMRWSMPGEEIIDKAMRFYLGKESPVISVRPDPAFDYSLKGVCERAPDYLVINHFYGWRFTGQRKSYPDQREFFTTLFNNTDPHYRRIATFKPPHFPLLNPPVQFADDYISVYGRGDGADRRAP